MYFLTDGEHLFMSNSLEVSRAVAKELNSNVEDDSTTRPMLIDFGGCLRSNMVLNSLSVNGRTYNFYAHHLMNLMHALGNMDSAKIHAEIKGYPLIYCFPMADAIALKQAISDRWEEMKQGEMTNLYLWEQALGALAGNPRVEIPKKNQVVKYE